MITINSGAQIHPLIATRWCSSLKGKNLHYVMVANHGYLPDRVNFAARIAKHRVNADEPMDLIAAFKAAAALDPGMTSYTDTGNSFLHVWQAHIEAAGPANCQGATDTLTGYRCCATPHSSSGSSHMIRGTPPTC